MKSYTGLAVLAACLFSVQTIAGIDSGGGGSIVCRGQDGKITMAELLDLWELSITDPGFLVVRSEAPVESQINTALEKIRSAFGNVIAEKLLIRINYVRARILYMPPETDLVPPKDTAHLFMKRGCSLEGVALYDDSQDRLWINRDLYDSLPPTDQTALLFHEAIYWERRHPGVGDVISRAPLFSPDVNSVITRKFVARLFSNFEWPTIPSQGISSIMNCGDGIKVMMANGHYFAVRVPSDIGLLVANASSGIPHVFEPINDRFIPLLSYVDRTLNSEEWKIARDLYASTHTAPCQGPYEKGQDNVCKTVGEGEFVFSVGIEGSKPEYGAQMVYATNTLYGWGTAYPVFEIEITGGSIPPEGGYTFRLTPDRGRACRTESLTSSSVLWL